MARESLDPTESLWDLIADDLRFWRDHHGLSLAQVGQEIGLTRYTVGDVERGRHHLQEAHARRLDKLWNLNQHFTRLIRFAKARHNRDWISENTEIEAQADVIKTYEALVVPGLLQTPGYARALLEAGGEQDVEGFLAKRMARQAVL
jgi:transcriptional regulator with XRE-family HTH domain